MELFRYIRNSFCEARHIPIKIIVICNGTYIHESNTNIYFKDFSLVIYLQEMKNHTIDTIKGIKRIRSLWKMHLKIGTFL